MVSPAVPTWARRLPGAMRRALGLDAALVTAAAAAAVVAAVVVAGGLAAGLDRRLSDGWFRLSQGAPSGQIVLVDVAHAARDGGDALHLSRTRLAALLRICAAAGVRRTLVDLSLSGATAPAVDADLESALAALSPTRVALTASAVVESDAGGAPRWRRTEVYAPLARHAERVASDLAFDNDGQLRRFGVEGARLPALLSGADWLAGQALDSRSRRIDYGIDAARLPMVDALDLLGAGADVGRIAGRSVVIASSAAALGGEIRVPRFGALRRATITALSAETVLGGRVPRAIDGPLAVLALALLASCMTLWAARLGPLLGAAAVCGGALCAIGIAAQLQIRSGLIVPAATPVVALLLGYAAAQLARHPALSGLRLALRGLVGGGDLRLAHPLEGTGEALVTFAPDGAVLSMNAAARQLFARTPGGDVPSVADLIGAQADELLSATRASRPGRVVAVIDGDGPGRRHLDLTVSAMQAEAGDWIGVASIRDVTDQQAQIEELRRMVVQDPLTGLLNRLGFERALADGCVSAGVAQGMAPAGDDMAVLMCDLDGFKGVNDTLGHQAGDLLLCEIARRLGAAVPPGTVVARLGGDEFGLILRATHLERDDAAALAGTLAAAVAAPITIGAEAVVVGISVGIALHPSQGYTPDALVRVADTAMYRDKHRRNAAARRRGEAA